MTNHDQIYCKLKNDDRTFEMNMPEPQAMMFLTLFDDDGYTWSGLADLMNARFSGTGDLEDFMYLLKKGRNDRL